MPQFLLTHSLLSSWLYAIKDDPYSDATTERDPMADFMLTLRREPTPTTEAMQRGIDFENLVTAILSGEAVAQEVLNDELGYDKEPTSYKKFPRWFDAAARVAYRIKGGTLQYKASKRITVNSMDIVLYGRLDALKAGEIYDIKFSGSYERGKYFDSTQHPVYMELVPEAQHFTYIISNGTEVWTERYTREETPNIMPIISYFLDWLKFHGLLETYKEHWSAK